MNLIDMFYREIEDAKKRKVPLVILSLIHI